MFDRSQCFLKNAPECSTQVDQIGLWDDYPERWGRDCGIDLIFKHKNGKTWAVQSKCYSPEYSITKSDVDTFLSESNRELIDKRLLHCQYRGIANITYLPAFINSDANILSYDSGSGNGLMDLWCKKHLDCHYDKVSAFACSSLLW